MRLVVLMVEVEQPEGISTRKLVLETARHNVITAYDVEAGASLLRRFPNVDLAVVHSELDNSSFDETVKRLKAVRPDLKIIGVSPTADGGASLRGADYIVNSHDPHALLDILVHKFEAATSDSDSD